MGWGEGGGSVRKHLERANLYLYIYTPHPLLSLLNQSYVASVHVKVSENKTQHVPDPST